jgi:1-acyl-sn-glycerol-3-phosphate acyltransferase
MTILKSIVIWVISIILTVALFFVELFFYIVLFPFDKKKKFLHAQCYWWSNAIIKMNPSWSLQVRGLENIDKLKTYVIVANHQSLADIVVLYKTQMQFKWIAKDSLFRVPFVGWCLSLTRHIRISRGKHGSIKKVYREAAGWLRKDISVLFFPEGTRSETDDMGVFQNGAFKLAIKEKRPVLPISIKGTRGVVGKGRWLFDTKASCIMTILPSIETDRFQMGDFAHLRDMVQTRLAGITA